MANPRNQASRQTVKPLRETFVADSTTLPFTAGGGPGAPFNHGTAKYGYAVAALTSGTVGLPAATTTGVLVGRLELIERDQRCTVLVGPNIFVPYTNGTVTNTVNVGDAVVCDEYGLAKTDTTSKARGKVVSKDTTAGTVEVLI